MIRYIFILMVVLATSVAGLLYWSYTAPGASGETKVIYFERGKGFMAITQELADAKIIRESISIRIAAVLKGQNKKIKAGEYEFMARMSPKDVLEKLVSGEQIVHKITIPEGLKISEIKELINSEPMLSGILPETLTEGSVLPETYHFLRGDSREALLKKMQISLREQSQKLWAARSPKLPFNSVDEAIILASIVEKETGVNDERARVAAVFINRLNQGIKLQSDPTTAYAIELSEGKMSRSLTYDDLKRELPHNTYFINGLPPTPIANPGIASIKAVLNPLQTNELFFVANGNGGHAFAATLKEHEENVAKYRIWQKAQVANR